MVLALQCPKMAVAGFAFVQPDEDAAAFRERAEIDFTIVIDVGSNDRNDTVVGGEDLRSAAREAHDDVVSRAGATGQPDRAPHPH